MTAPVSQVLSEAARERLAEVAYMGHQTRQKPWSRLSAYHRVRWLASADAVVAALAKDQGR